MRPPLVKASAARTVRIVTSSGTDEEANLILSLVTLEGASLGNVTTRLLVAPQRPAARRSNAEAAALGKNRYKASVFQNWGARE